MKITTILKLFLSFIFVWVFAALAVYSQQPCVKYPLSDYCHPEPVKKAAAVHMHQREQIKDLWNITEAQISEPVNLWSKK